MTGVGKYDDAAWRSLGLHDAALLSTRTLGKSRIAVKDTASGADSIRITVQACPADGSHHEPCSGGEPVFQPYAAGSLRIVDLCTVYSATVACAQQAVCFYIPRALVSEFSDESGSQVTDLSCPPGTIDPVMAHLAQALLPTFELTVDHSSAFVDHVALAAVSHLAHRYGGLTARRPAARGGLSMLQERRARHHLTTNAGRDVSLAEVAKACGLSRASFISAFARTTGLTPHRWLQQYRLQQVRSLLLNSSTAAAEIALRCGFADQSHMTRVFKRHVGTSPVAWRRQHRQDAATIISATD
jgi:AraC family transcriptional regulator